MADRTGQSPSELTRPAVADRLTVDRVGRQLVLDARGVPAELLQDADAMQRLARELAAACEARVLAFCAHEFESTGGLTALAILSSSHVALHTWPEFGYLAADVFCCTMDVDVRAVVAVLAGLADGVTVTSSAFARPFTSAPEAGND